MLNLSKLIVCLFIYFSLFNRLRHLCNGAVHDSKDNQFFIFSKAQSNIHLSVFELIFIILRKPNLCRQKQFVYKHKLLI